MRKFIPFTLARERFCNNVVNLCFRLNDSVVKRRISVGIDQTSFNRPLGSFFSKDLCVFHDLIFVFCLKLFVLLPQVLLIHRLNHQLIVLLLLFH